MNETLEIPTAHLTFSLHAGYIDRWLVAGPHAVPVSNLDRYPGADFKAQIARAYYQGESAIAQPPAELSQFDVTGPDGVAHPLKWLFFRCKEDHFVDLTAFYHTCHYLRSWAYAQLMAPVTQQATLVLTTNGPADLWLNGEHVHRHEHFAHQIPQSVSFPARLCEGYNEILVRFEAVGVRECPYSMALQIENAESPGYSVILPTTLEPLVRRQSLEEVLLPAYLDQDVYHRENKLVVHWPQAMRQATELTVRLQTPAGRIYAEGQVQARGGAAANLGAVYQVPEGEYQVLLMPKPEEYYVHGMRVLHRLPLRVANNKYSTNLYGAYEQRRREALEDAARRNLNLYSEIAKIELGQWSNVKFDPIRTVIDSINQRADCSDFYLVGLLGLMIRHRSDPSFPEELEWPLSECILNFKYWMDEPGNDAMCFWSENHQILFHACEILAGQLYPERVFTNANQTGAWHREKGERMALSWLRKRCTGGFREWDSNCYFEEDVLALSHLADLAGNDDVAELAAITLDKLFFTLAVNSQRGVFGSTHGRTYTSFIKGGRGEPTAGISRLLWGMGVFNDRILGTVGLACSQSYELPPILAAIALDQPEEMWNRERHSGVLEEWCDRAGGAWEINKVTYRTPDYMLASAQDYRPGEPGYQQHIWQATLAPDAVVFVTHPPCCSEDNSHRPNFWHGNVILPRVAQWKDVLVAVHKLPAGDWLGFTHAYFPQATFDEVKLVDHWAFARKENGYIALCAAQKLHFVIDGDSAYRELRSPGHHNIWLCQMGRRALDGTFADFVDKVLALDLTFTNHTVTFLSLRGEVISFGWDDPLRVNGVEQTITGFNHYDNPYCQTELDAELMEIRYLDQGLRLNFALGK